MGGEGGRAGRAAGRVLSPAAHGAQVDEGSFTAAVAALPASPFPEALEEPGGRGFWFVCFFLVQPKVSANAILESKIGDVDKRAVLCSLETRNFDTFHRRQMSEE